MYTELSVLPTLHLLDDLESPLPLEHTTVRACVTGLVGTVTVTQRFRNPLTSLADLEYLFPLPHAAAITALELLIGERTIRASVYEIQQARQEYAAARSQGRHASLLDGRRPNLFALQLANIQPGEFIQVVTSYQQRLELSAGSCEFVFPMGLTPKYHRPGQAAEASGVDAPLAHDNSQVGDVEICVEFDNGFMMGAPFSPTHPLLISHPDPDQLAYRVTLDGVHLPDRDFVLRWRLDDHLDDVGIQFPAWCSPGREGYFLATFVPPVVENTASSLPREYIFVLDRSGSMSGEPILQAVNALRACLRTLNSQDTFAILLFDDRLEWLAPQTAVTQAAIDQVDLRLSQVGGRGGTDILPALEAALLLPSLILPEKPQPARLVVFLTDGAVSAEEQTLKMTRLSIGNTRLFTFGVGSSVNRAFLQQLARIGRGESTFIALDEDIEEAILRFQDRIAFPLLTNLSLHAEGCQVWDIYPAQLPDLYADRPLEVIGRYKYTGDGDQPAHLVARGERAGTPIEVHSTLVVNPSNPEVLSRLWARARVDELLEQVELRQKPEHVARTEIIHLAMDASLLTKYTAFLAVDSVVNASSGRSQFIKVAQPLPEGLQEYSIFDNLANNPPMSAPMPANSANIHHLSDSSMLAEEDFLVSENQPAFSMPKFVGEAKNIAPKLLKRVRLANRSMELSAPNDAPSDAKNIFHELARSQQLNGSWKEDVEITAAALLAFVRSGHTTQKGHYRKLVQRAFTWLAETHAFGFAGFLRALALRELAQATQSPAHTAAFDAVMAGLPAPQSGLESTVFNILTNAPEAIPPMLKADSLDDLRLAVVTGSPCSQIAPELIRDDLGQALAAGLNSY